MATVNVESTLKHVRTVQRALAKLNEGTNRAYEDYDGTNEIVKARLKWASLDSGAAVIAARDIEAFLSKFVETTEG